MKFLISFIPFLFKTHNNYLHFQFFSCQIFRQIIIVINNKKERVIYTPKKGTNIYKRKDGRWEARYLKSISKDGKRIYGSVYGKTFDEAKLKQEKFIQDFSLITQQNTTVVFTLKDISIEWKDSIKQSVKESTYLKYDTIIRKHILSHDISTINMINLTTKEIYDYSEQLRKEGLSSKTINDILVVLGLILKYTEDIYEITKPKIKFKKVQKKELRVLSSQEQMVLERFLLQETNSYKLGVLIALYTGIRIGELCALQWEDVQFDRIIINKTVQRLKRGERTVLCVTTPKTSSSIRDIPIPQFLKKYLELFREKGSVVKNLRGNSVEPRLMQITFDKYIEECGLEKTNFHALRHTFATRCVESGFDIKSLSDILGHSDVKTTLNRYVHSTMNQKKKNMDLLVPLTAI